MKHARLLISGIFEAGTISRLLLSEIVKCAPAQCPPAFADQWRAFAPSPGRNFLSQYTVKSNNISRALSLDHGRRAARQRL
ncbi:hypothetical protein CBM2589_A90708 [Cupriavidus taiwanensis]|uniref:Uncharacterized protein n=1 Tax=Cupriavidus taiwanensis TaxID=164546 RepID=A0A375CG48_9BURK|nr:hypothetical protein CBM2589_A90708 [Cupriavidus taiwanensis]